MDGKRALRTVASNVLVALLYWGTGRVGLLLPFAGAHVTLIWPPIGIAVSSLLLLGPRVAPGVFIGAVLVNLPISPSPLTAGAIAVGNVAGPLVASFLLRGSKRFSVGINTVYSFFLFVLGAVFLAPLLTAVNGSTVLFVSGLAEPREYLGVLFAWFIGDAGGVIGWATPILLWAGFRREALASLSAQLEAIFCSMIVLGSVLLACIGAPRTFTPTAFLLLLPPLVVLPWIAGRFHPWLAAVVGFLGAHILLCSTSLGVSPFASLGLHEGLAVCWGYLGVLMCISLTVGALCEELRTALRDARLALETQTQFLASVSHELRTPLHGILGILEMTRAARLDREISDMLNTAHSSARTLLGLINDILDLTRIRSGYIALTPSQFLVANFVESIQRLFEPLMSEKKLVFVATVEGSGPSSITADEMKLRQIVTNLVSNAVKFTPPGGTVTLSALVSEPEYGEFPTLRVTVSDSGIGISPESRESIFEPFVQEDSTIARRYGGTGLGLSISRSLVQRMGGTITLVSRKGEGSSFVVTVPVHDRHESGSGSEIIRSFESPMMNAPGEGKTIHILLAEDNVVNQRLFLKMLENTRYEVTVVEIGRYAVAVAREREFDAILLDIQMPEMDGIMALSHLRTIPWIQEGKTPIVAVTAHGMEDEKRAFLGEGFSDYLAKPFSREELLNLLNRIVRPSTCDSRLNSSRSEL